MQNVVQTVHRSVVFSPHRSLSHLGGLVGLVRLAPGGRQPVGRLEIDLEPEQHAERRGRGARLSEVRHTLLGARNPMKVTTVFVIDAAIGITRIERVSQGGVTVVYLSTYW